MAFELLPTNYTDAVWDGRKKYNEITNDDGTVSFEDVTVYSNKEDSFFGSKDANKMNEALNYIMSSLENGTDLYEEFKTYFETQKTNFQSYFNTQKTDFESSADDTQSAFTKYINELKALDDSTNSDYQKYITDLKSQADSVVSTIKTDYRSEMDEYESQQQAIFNAWFTGVQGKLSGDIATNLQNEVDRVDTAQKGFDAWKTEFSTDGKTITQTSGTDKIVTTFDSDTVITQKYYKDDVLTKTKTITFSEDGSTISEEVI